MYDHTSIVERILWRCRIMFQLALPYLRYVSPKSVLDFEAEIKLTSLKVEIGVQIRCPFYQPSGSELSRQIVLRQMPGSNQSSQKRFPSLSLAGVNHIACSALAICPSSIED